MSFKGDELAQLVGMARDGSEDAVAELRAAPVIESGSKFYWSRFQDLGSDRPPAFSGVSRIPFQAVRSYADEEGMTGKMREAFIRVIRNVDTAYCAMLSEKAAKASSKQAK